MTDKFSEALQHLGHVYEPLPLFPLPRTINQGRVDWCDGRSIYWVFVALVEGD